MENSRWYHYIPMSGDFVEMAIRMDLAEILVLEQLSFLRRNWLSSHGLS